MYKFTNKVLLGVLGFSLINSLTFAIDSEFKNSLMKIELNKVTDGAYSVNLYTKNKFQEPVKVIKKSDLNYYILLPETKNESTRTTNVGPEIRNISTNVYPYAGQDVKNGYVKINIDTTKPVEFRVNVKNIEATSKAAQNTTLAQVEPTKKEIQKQESVPSEKKNSISSNSKKEQIKPQINLKPKQNPKTRVEAPIPKIEEIVQQEVEKAKEEMLQELEEESFEAQETEFESENSLNEEELNELAQIAQDSKKITAQKISFKQKLSNKLSQYGITLKEFALMFGAFFVSFLFMLAFLTRKAPQTKLQSKADLIEKNPTSNTPQEPQIKNDGQYFVFDKNVKQIGFCDPSTSALKKNYELSTYEPELKNKYNRNLNPTNKKFESEYDIIQKILKEDTFIDLPAQNTIQQTKLEAPKEALSAPAVSEPIKEEKEEARQEVEAKKQTQPIIQTQPSEPIVLSSVEIAPERGFMCVSYNDNISLLGYIFDDVFALYNFKTQKLENYEIKFRLSEKDDKLARFIVKIMDTKMLIKVTKSQMVMEVLL